MLDATVYVKEGLKLIRDDEYGTPVKENISRIFERESPQERSERKIEESHDIGRQIQSVEEKWQAKLETSLNEQEKKWKAKLQADADADAIDDAHHKEIFSIRQQVR
jgi:hypothetical protein